MKFYSYVSWLEKEHPSSLELLCFVHNNGSDRRVTRCVKRTRLKVRLRRPTNGRDTTNERFVSSEKDSLSLFAAISKYIVRYSSKRASFRQLVTFFTNRHRSRGWRKILSKQSYRYNFAIRARKEIIDFRSEFCKKKKKSAARVKQCSYEIRFVFGRVPFQKICSIRWSRRTMELRLSHVHSLKRNFTIGLNVPSIDIIIRTKNNGREWR